MFIPSFSFCRQRDSAPFLRRQLGRWVGCMTTLLLPACANVSFHSDPSLQARTGLKYYIAKPYLLVSRTGNKDNPVKIDLIQLPDLEHPNYAVYHPGWGSHQFNLTLTNGILTTYGQTADSKGPETIKAVADLASQAGAGFGSIAAGVKALRTEAANVDPAIAAIERAMGKLNAIVNMPTEQIGPFAGKKDEAGRFEIRLREVWKSLKEGNNAQADTLDKIKADIGSALIAKPEAVGPAVAINNYLTGAQSDIDAAITALRNAGAAPKPAEKPDIELYEIRMQSGRTQLIKVETSVAKTMLQQSQTTTLKYGR